MEYQGVNGDEDVRNASPDAFRFHGPFKSLVRMVLARVRTPQSWLDNLTDNIAVIRDIYYDYLEHELQTKYPGEGS
jgi:hypothetical protein